MRFFTLILSFLTFFTFTVQSAEVELGIDRLFTKDFSPLLQGKKIGLVTNHTAINSNLQSTLNLIKSQSKIQNYTLKALFAPEHGLTGNQYASEDVEHSVDVDGIPIYSLHGETRRPTQAMLKDINLLIFDIQDIGSRSYTYITTLFYVMEEAAKLKIPVIVLDRPNPINGLVIDGPILQPNYRSMVGYINIPYCHGMTIGELALYFNGEYKIQCDLTVIPMKGWKRAMTFHDTGLKWIPTSPHIPEANTAFYYPITGILGELSLVNIGVGYTLPFKVVGAPWLDGSLFAQRLNEQNFPGVYFHPFHYRPFFGKFAREDCQGVLIQITNSRTYQPLAISYLLMGTLKSLYPTQFKKSLQFSEAKLTLFNKFTGTPEVYRILKEEKYVTWKLKELHQKEKEAFILRRKKYLLFDYKD